MNRQDIHIRTNPMYDAYLVGMWYKGKGTYLGESKGAHKFQRHNTRKFQHMDGAKYFFEKV